MSAVAPDVVAGIDAARRVGWAKFYTEQRKVESLKRYSRFLADVLQSVFDDAVGDVEQLAHLNSAIGRAAVYVGWSSEFAADVFNDFLEQSR